MSDDRERIDEGELTTADLAERVPQRLRDAERDEESPPEQMRDPEPTDEGSETPDALFPPEDAEHLRGRWTAIQGSFVDEPRRAVEDADGLVAAAIKRVAETFADERARLESQWDQGDDVSTEDLRQSLRRYRAFFDRILSM